MRDRAASVQRRIGRAGLAAVAMAVLVPTACAAPSSGAVVQDAEAPPREGAAALLLRLPQRTRADGGPCSRHLRHGARRGPPRSLGGGGAQAPDGSHAARRPAAPRPGDVRGRRRVARDGARPGGRGTARPGAPDAAPPEPRRVPECRPRPAGRRDRRRASPRGQRRLRLRQQRRCPDALHGAHRALPGRRGPDRGARPRPSAGHARPRDDPHPDGSKSGRALERRAAVRFARRRRVPLPLPGRRRVPLPDAAEGERRRGRVPRSHRRAAPARRRS